MFCINVWEHLDLIQSLEEQISKIRFTDNFKSDIKARKRVKTIKKVLDKAYSKLDDGEDDSDTSDEEKGSSWAFFRISKAKIISYPFGHCDPV